MRADEVDMLELSGWGPLLALWIGGAIHLARIIRTERENSRSAMRERKAA